MSITDRHKRPGGFRKLIESLETTPLERRTKIIEAMRAEDPEFAATAVAHLFDFTEFAEAPDTVLCELVVAMKDDSRTMALALYHLEPSFVDKFTRNMPATVRRLFNDANDELKDVKANERASAQFRVIAKARELEGRRVFVLKRYTAPYPDK